MNRRTFLRTAAAGFGGLLLSSFLPAPETPVQDREEQHRHTAMQIPPTFAEAFAQEWGEALVQGIEEGLKASKPVTLKAQFSTDGVKWIDVSGYRAVLVLNGKEQVIA